MEIISKPIVSGRHSTRSWATTLARVGILVLTLAVVAYIAVCGVAADQVSHPERKPVIGTPADYGMNYERVSFKSAVDNIPLEGWYVDSPGTKVIVMFHGRNGVRNDTDWKAMKITKAFVQRNYDVFTFDFRAHGESGGERYSFGEFEVRDVAGALDYLKGRGITEVGAIGYSMGAATELNAAPDHPEMRVIVSDSAFAEAAPIIERNLQSAAGLPTFVAPGLMGMARVLYGVDLYNNQPQRQVARLSNRPLLIIHGTADDLIPLSHAYALQKAAAGNPNVQLWIVPGACHTCAYDVDNTAYIERVIGFYDTYWK